MRQETNNEMDLLLRRLSRRQEVFVSDDDSDHLDADELSSYAENTLPAAARTRYTEHLAECSRCREIVVQLSASVPVVAARETVTAVEPSALRKFLASFFTPMVLRYAVPALGLIVVAAIGFVALRSSSQRSSIAQLETKRQPEPSQSEQPSAGSSGVVSEAHRQAASQPAAPAPGDNAPKESKTVAQEAQPVTKDLRAESNRDAPAPTTALPAVENAAAPAPPAASPAATVDEVRVDVQGQRNQAVGRVAATTDLAKQKAAEEQEKKLEMSPASRQPARARGATPQAGAESTGFAMQEKDKDKEKGDGLIRSVGNKRFRKQSGVWVDTAYDSGSSFDTVARGSERYRALIADEPDIKTIADTLEGTIILVWKGRTYRIQ